MKKILKIVWILLVFAACSKGDDLKTDDENINKSENQKATGSSSHDLLSDDTFKSLVIELVYVEGLKPSQNTIDNIISFLNARTFKPNSITVETRAIASTGKTSYTNQDITTIEDATRTKYNTNNQIAVWALFIDGASANTTNSNTVLGTAYRNTSFVIFEETIQELSNSAFEPNRTLLETTVITHELGHLLGLTNFGSNMVENHEDAEYTKHCNVESCLMYWAAESGSGLSNLMGANTTPQLDAKCIADLQANGGK